LAEFADALAESTSRRLDRQFLHDLEQDSTVRIIRAGTEFFHRGVQLYDERMHVHLPEETELCGELAAAYGE
jgi:hypothetical protein